MSLWGNVVSPSSEKFKPRYSLAIGPLGVRVCV